jgi:hypothetical protein
LKQWLKIRLEAEKLQEESLGERHLTLVYAEFLTLKASATKAKIDKWDLIKYRDFVQKDVVKDNLPNGCV